MQHIPTWILMLCGNGERLCKTVGVNRAGNPVTSYCFEPSGTHVEPEQAVAHRLELAALEQTWRLKGVTKKRESR